jgi:DNA-binding MarR family transcriptional regulator
MIQQDLVLVLHAQGKSDTTIHQHLVEAIDELAISYATVSRTIRSLSWNSFDDESPNFGGQP